MPERPIKPNNIPPEALCPPGNPYGKTGHRIKIETPNGETSNGRCSLCDFEREYFNAPKSDFNGYGKKIHPEVTRSSTGPRGLAVGGKQLA